LPVPFLDPVESACWTRRQQQHPDEEDLMNRFTRTAFALLVGSATVVATGLTTAEPALAATFYVRQTPAPSNSIKSGQTISITYSWAGGGARMTTQWGSRGTEVHETVTNTRTVQRVLTTCHRQERINVYTTVVKGNGDRGSAALPVYVSAASPPYCD
jgi:hypothetical protein